MGAWGWGHWGLHLGLLLELMLGHLCGSQEEDFFLKSGENFTAVLVLVEMTQQRG